MLFPEQRLSGWSALVVVPFVAIAEAVPTARLLCLFIVALFIGLVVWDAIVVFWKCPELELDFPKQIRGRVGEKASFEFVLNMLSAKQYRFVLDFTGPLKLEQNPIQLHCPNSSAKLVWSWLPLARGDAQFVKLACNALSPFGFWRRESIVSLLSSVQIFPHFKKDQPRASALVHQLQTGAHSIAQSGIGQDFDRCRLYERGDAWSDIDWKLTAKHRFPITRLYRQERSQEVLVLLDISRNSSLPCGTGQECMLDHALQTALWVNRLAKVQGDKMGLLCYDNQIRSYIKPSCGPKHDSLCLDSLYRLQPSDKAPDYREVFSFIRHHLKKRALLISLSQLPDALTREAYLEGLNLILRQHLTVVASFESPFDHEALGGPSLTTNEELYQALEGHMNWEDQRNWAFQLKQRGVDFLHGSPQRLTFSLLKHYLNIKARGAL